MKRYIAIDLVTAKELEISLNEWVLLENILFMSKNSSGYCFASKKTLAEILQVSQRTIFILLEKLVLKNYLFRSNSGRLKVTEKWINVSNGNTAKIAYPMQNLQSNYAKSAVQPMQNLHIKEDIKKENKGEARALDFLMNNSPSDYEVFLIQNKKNIKDFEKFTKDFNDKVDIEGIEFTSKKLNARLGIFTRNWIENKNKFNKSEDEKVIPIYRRKIS